MELVEFWKSSPCSAVPIDKMNDAPDADIAVFTQALGLPPEERDRYLDQACKGDIEFRRRVEALLLAYEHAGDFLGRPAAERPPKAAAQVLAVAEKPGDRIWPLQVAPTDR